MFINKYYQELKDTDLDLYRKALEFVHGIEQNMQHTAVKEKSDYLESEIIKYTLELKKYFQARGPKFDSKTSLVCRL